MMDGLVGAGEVKHSTDLARLGHVSPARLSQILRLLHLAPEIQERVLFLDITEAQFLTEGSLRNIAREPHWNRQRLMFEALFHSRG
jgi:hypothetical protein